MHYMFHRNNIQHNSYIIQCIHILPNKNSRNPLRCRKLRLTTPPLCPFL